MISISLAKTLTLLSLAVTLEPSTAAVLPSRVTVVGYSQDQVIRKIPEGLPWNSRIRTRAALNISADRRRLQTALGNLAQKGAYLVESLTDGSSAAFKPGSLKTPSQFVLEGLNSSGQTVGNAGPFPSDAKDIASSLTRLSSVKCLLSDSTKAHSPGPLLPVCKILSPTSTDYLKSVIQGAIAFTQPSDLYSFRIQELNYIVANNLKFSIRGGQIVCPELSKLSPNETAISLSDKSAIGGYTITVTEDGSGFTFTEIAPDFVRLARDAYVLPGETWIRFQ